MKIEWMSSELLSFLGTYIFHHKKINFTPETSYILVWCYYVYKHQQYLVLINPWQNQNLIKGATLTITFILLVHVRNFLPKSSHLAEWTL